MYMYISYLVQNSLALAGTPGTPPLRAVEDIIRARGSKLCAGPPRAWDSKIPARILYVAARQPSARRNRNIDLTHSRCAGA